MLVVHFTVHAAGLPPPTMSIGIGRWFRDDKSVPHLTHGAVAGSAYFGARRQAASFTANTSGGFPTTSGWTDAPDLLLPPGNDTLVRRGQTVCYEVRTFDAINTAGPWSAPVCTASILDDRSLTRAGTWTLKKPTSGYFANTSVVATTKGASLTLANVHARRVALYAITCATCGGVNVLVGGVKVGSLSLYSATTKHVFVGLPAFAYRAGTLKLVTTSAKTVTIDGVGVAQR